MRKRRARVNVIRSVRHRLDYVGKSDKAIGEIDRKIVLGATEFMDKHREA